MDLQVDTSGYKQASRAEYRGYKQDTNRGEYNGIWNNLAQEIIERIIYIWLQPKVDIYMEL